MSSLTPPPLFTVVMPCFRAAATIGAAIASVLGQSEARLELIVVDDGSPDDSVAAALAAIGGDPRGRVIRQSNAGPSAARNRGVAAGSGAFIAFLDADDRWSTDCLARHRAHFAAEAGLGLSFGRVRFFDAAMAIPGRISAHHARPDLAMALAENPLCSTSNMVVRRDAFAALGGFDCDLRHAEDQEFVVRMLARTPWIVAGIDAELVHYRTSPGGLSADLGAMARGWQAMLERARGYADPAALAKAEPAARARFCRYLARRALRTGRPVGEAVGYLRAVLRADARDLLAVDFRRTALTALGVAAALLLPRRLVQTVLSR